MGDTPEQSGIDPTAHGAGITPPSRVSAPEFVDWHMILDQELDQLTAPQTGVLGAIGFTALGAMFGVAPSFVTALHKSPAKMVAADIVSIVVFTGTLVAAAICLALFFMSLKSKKDLPTTIRARKRRAVPGGELSAPNAFDVPQSGEAPSAI